MAWYFEKYSKKGPDEFFSFGYARFSLLGALINSMVLIIGSILVLSQSIPRIFQPESVNAEGMLVFAILGIVINGLAVIRLRKGTSLNEKVVSWHLLEDVLGWIAVLIVSILLMFINLPILDPILSIIITLYVLFNVIKNIKAVMHVFLQGVPRNYSIGEIEEQLLKIPGVLSSYHTHIWSLEGEKNQLTTHIIVEDQISREDIISMKNEIQEVVRQNGIEHVTIQVDYQGEEVDTSVTD